MERKFPFVLVNTKYIASRALKISAYSLVLHTDFFNALDEILMVFTPKK